MSCLLWWPSVPVYSLPIGFGYNQGPHTISELKSEHFIVYYDKETPQDGKLALTSLVAARPHLESWFDVRREDPLIVNIGAHSTGASFANFITDSIELQTGGLGSRDLAWHEYVHSTMYRQLDNWFGPAGSILHLPWMPAWFIEGLAEALSVSVGSDVQAGIERQQALGDSWPSYDKLHSLYSTGAFQLRGYATSGAFVAYILRTYGAGKLPQLLHDFYHYSMPWMWPWASVPFNGFMPMDKALQNMTGKTGEELYEEYKQSATKHWRAASYPSLLDQQLGSATAARVRPTVDDPDANAYPISVSANFSVYTQSFIADHVTGKVLTKLVVTSPKNARRVTVPLRAEAVSYIGQSTDRIFWLEHRLQSSKLCSIAAPIKNKPIKVCHLEKNLPDTLEVLGTEEDPNTHLVKTLWLAQNTQHLNGDKQKIYRWQPQQPEIFTLVPETQGKILQVASHGGKFWALSAGRTMRQIQQIDPNTGRCLAALTPADFPLSIYINAEKQIAVSLYGSGANVNRAFTQPISGSCTLLGEHTSPLLAAVQKSGSMSLAAATQDASIWTDAKPSAPPPTDLVTPGEPYEAHVERQYRARHILTFPWIGAEDALGPQIGVVSVPFMDHLQNETLRVTTLFGVQSRFPYTEASLTSTRYSPTLTLAGFRQQTYNGNLYSTEEERVYSSYLDEKGMRLDGDLVLRWLKSSLGLSFGYKYAHLKPYLGPTGIRHGFLHEPYGGLTFTQQFSFMTWSSSIRGRVAPAELNKEFDYNVLGVASTVSFPTLYQSHLDLGIEGSRTRGKKTRELKEMYQPLKTFVPGSGGGYNQNSFELTTDYGLFAPSFGDSQARSKATFTIPVVADIAKQVWLIYFDRLDFSTFFNYGGAWRNKPAPSSEQLIAAHGYNLDLLMENKGVRFNAGIGTGQVVGNNFQVYTKFGFDALF